MVGVEGEKEIDAYTLEMDYAGFKTFEMITLNLVHSVYGVVASKNLKQKNKYDSRGVKKVIKQWEKRFGKIFLQCETKWED